jgi:hypothetical protein
MTDRVRRIINDAEPGIAHLPNSGLIYIILMYRLDTSQRDIG